MRTKILLLCRKQRGTILALPSKSSMMKKSFILFIIVSISIVSCEELTDDNSPILPGDIEGHWKCNENSSNFKSTEDFYNVYIYEHTSRSGYVSISNFYQLGDNNEVAARLSGNKLIIEQQFVDGFSIIGSGTVSIKLDQINLTYTVDDGSGIEDNVEATYTFLY